MINENERYLEEMRRQEERAARKLARPEYRPNGPTALLEREACRFAGVWLRYEGGNCGAAELQAARERLLAAARAWNEEDAGS